MVTSLDLKRITELLFKTSMNGKLLTLEDKLFRAQVVCPEEVPPNLITMNSEVVINDSSSPENQTLRLVYRFSPLHKDQASVLSPIGTALLGMKVNETSTFRLRDGTPHTIKVVGIVFQPEANKLYEL